MSELRATRPHELPLLAQLLDDVFRRSKGVLDQSQLTDFPLVYCPENLSNSRVIVEDTRIVSHAALWPRQLIVQSVDLKSAIICSVATFPEYRMRGYAATLMRSLQQTLVEESYDIAILWTSVPDFYLKLGWQAVAPGGLLVTLDGSSIPSRDNGPTIVAYDESSHLDQLLAIHDHEPVRMQRTRDEYQKLFKLPKINVYTTVIDGRVQAYLAHGNACNKRGLIEYGGPANDIMALAEHVARDLDEPVDWTVFSTRQDLMERVLQSSLPHQPLCASKGAGTEMILPLRDDVITDSLLQNLFVWGLEWA
ncbi:MAG: hypothetical protein CMJ78_13970 [Planctomycetaceae bacterium]|nr:hypothetical protein [Planctomycetaceae bacterium]